MILLKLFSTLVSPILLHGEKHRQAVANFRISVHTCPVEVDRYAYVEHKNRCAQFVIQIISVTNIIIS